MAGILPDVAGVSKFCEPMADTSRELAVGTDDSEHLKEFRRELKEGRQQGALQKSDARLDRTV